MEAAPDGFEEAPVSNETAPQETEALSAEADGAEIWRTLEARVRALFEGELAPRLAEAFAERLRCCEELAASALAQSEALGHRLEACRSELTEREAPAAELCWEGALDPRGVPEALPECPEGSEAEAEAQRPAEAAPSPGSGEAVEAGRAPEAPGQGSQWMTCNRRGSSTSASARPAGSLQSRNRSGSDPSVFFNSSGQRGRISGRVVAGLAAIGSCLLLVLACGFRALPFFTLGFIVQGSLWMLYLCSEEPLIRVVIDKSCRDGRYNKKYVLVAKLLRSVQATRSSHENEHKMKAGLWTLTVTVLFFNSDTGPGSWLLVGIHFLPAVTSVCAAIVFTSFVFWRLEQRWHDKSLRKGGLTFAEVFGEDATLPGTAVLMEKMRLVVECMQARKKDSREGSQQVILEMLAMCDAETLNELVERMAQSAECSLERLLGHFGASAEDVPRSELVNLLCIERGSHLSVRARSELLHTLMVMRLSSCSNAEAAVEHLILGCAGDDLSNLKCFVDGAGDIHSMHKLIYQDITDQGIKERVLNHFIHEGAVQVAHRVLMASGHFRELMRLGKRHNCRPQRLDFLEDVDDKSKEDDEDEAPPPTDKDDKDAEKAKEREREKDKDASPGGCSNVAAPSYAGKCGHAWLKIITDMDDTMMSSGGRWPAGIDGRYPRHVPYPGVTAFYREIQNGMVPLAEQPEAGIPGQLVALSARPHLVGEMVEKKLFERFGKMQEEHNLHSMPALLTGSVDAGATFLVSGGTEEGMRALARKKFSSFEEYLTLYPEFRIVFVGDNGQADYAVGQMMCKHYRNNTEQVFIHKVQPIGKTWGYEPEVHAGMPAAFFEDYVEAAVIAATRPAPLVSPEGLHRIVVAAVDDFKKISNWASEGHRESALLGLNKSICKALQFLEAMSLPCADVDVIDADRVAALPEHTGGEDSTVPAPASGRSFFGRARGLLPSSVVKDPGPLPPSSPPKTSPVAASRDPGISVPSQVSEDLLRSQSPPLLGGGADADATSPAEMQAVGSGDVLGVQEGGADVCGGGSSSSSFSFISRARRMVGGGPPRSPKVGPSVSSPPPPLSTQEHLPEIERDAEQAGALGDPEAQHLQWEPPPLSCAVAPAGAVPADASGAEPSGSFGGEATVPDGGSAVGSSFSFISRARRIVGGGAPPKSPNLGPAGVAPPALPGSALEDPDRDQLETGAGEAAEASAPDVALAEASSAAEPFGSGEPALDEHGGSSFSLFGGFSRRAPKPSETLEAAGASVPPSPTVPQKLLEQVPELESDVQLVFEAGVPAPQPPPSPRPHSAPCGATVAVELGADSIDAIELRDSGGSFSIFGGLSRRIAGSAATSQRSAKPSGPGMIRTSTSTSSSDVGAEDPASASKPPTPPSSPALSPRAPSAAEPTASLAGEVGGVVAEGEGEASAIGCAESGGPPEAAPAPAPQRLSIFGGLRGLAGRGGDRAAGEAPSEGGVQASEQALAGE